MQLPYKRSPAQTRQNVLPIDRLPRYVRRLSDVNIIAWMVQATQLTIHQILTRPRLARERLLIALKRERRAERKRRIDLATWRLGGTGEEVMNAPRASSGSRRSRVLPAALLRARQARFRTYR